MRTLLYFSVRQVKRALGGILLSFSVRSSFQAKVRSGSNSWLGKLVRRVNGGRMIDFRPSTLLLQARTCIRPTRQIIAILGPVHQRCFVTPIWQLAHRSAMNAGQHKSFHRGIGGPDGSRPKGIALISQQFGCEVSLCFCRLPRRAESIKKKHREEAPGANAEPSDGDECH